MAGGEEGVGVMAKLAVISFRWHFFGGIFFAAFFPSRKTLWYPIYFETSYYIF